MECTLSAGLHANADFVTDDNPRQNASSTRLSDHFVHLTSGHARRFLFLREIQIIIIDNEPIDGLIVETNRVICLWGKSHGSQHVMRTSR
jgi:hypothetical protein